MRFGGKLTKYKRCFYEFANKYVIQTLTRKVLSQARFITIIISGISNYLIVNIYLNIQVIFKEEQKGVKQVLLLEDGTKFITISMKVTPNDVETVVNAAIVARTIPGKLFTTPL